MDWSNWILSTVLTVSYKTLSLITKPTNLVVYYGHFKNGKKRAIDMRSTSLPLVHHHTSLDGTWQTMREAKRSGVVLHEGRAFRLYTAGEVASARDQNCAKKLKPLAGVLIHVPALTLGRQPASSLPLSAELLLDSLRKSSKKYGLLSVPSGQMKGNRIYALDDAGVGYVEARPRDKGRRIESEPS